MRENTAKLPRKRFVLEYPCDHPDCDSKYEFKTFATKCGNGHLHVECEYRKLVLQQMMIKKTCDDFVKQIMRIPRYYMEVKYRKFMALDLAVDFLDPARYLSATVPPELHKKYHNLYEYYCEYSYLHGNRIREDLMDRGLLMYRVC